MATLALVPSPALTAAPLYAVEEHLAALIETAELVTPEQEKDFRAEFECALTTAIEKRDRVGQFMAHVENQIEFAKSEIKRLQERKQTYERVQERMEEYIVRIIEERGTPGPKGKMVYPKLEGKTVSFSIRGCPVSVEIKDEQKVPAHYKTYTIKISAAAWGFLLDGVDPDLRAQVLDEVHFGEVACDKKAIKADIEAGRPIEGADLNINKHSLVRK